MSEIQLDDINFKAGDVLLSRWTHYHRPRVLIGRVRDGNGSVHPGMVTGSSVWASFASARTPTVSYPLSGVSRSSPCGVVSRDFVNEGCASCGLPDSASPASGSD